MPSDVPTIEPAMILKHFALASAASASASVSPPALSNLMLTIE
jgi:hypothetical protein